MKNMGDILDKVHSAQYISKIDLSEAFYSIPMSREREQRNAPLLRFQGSSYINILECPSVYRTPSPFLNEIRCEEVKYLGYMFNQSGFAADPEMWN